MSPARSSLSWLRPVRCAAHRPPLGACGSECGAARRLPACPLRPPRRLSLWCALDWSWRPRALAVPLVEPGRDGPLGGADDPGARAARCDDARDLRGRAQRLRLAALGLAFAAYALLLDHDRLLLPPAPPAAPRWRSHLPHGSCPRSSATPRVSPSRSGVAASGSRSARLRDAALPARCRLARARIVPGRGDGGSWLRRGLVQRARPSRPGAARLGSRSRWRHCSSSWRRCGSSLRQRPRVLVPGLARRRSTASRSSWKLGRSSRSLAPRAPGSRRCCARLRGSCLTSTAAASPAGSSSPGSTPAAHAQPSSPARLRPSSRIRRTRS